MEQTVGQMGIESFYEKRLSPPTDVFYTRRGKAKPEIVPYPATRILFFPNHTLVVEIVGTGNRIEIVTDCERVNTGKIGSEE